MNCPKCGSQNVENSIKNGRIIKKRLPLWVGVVSIIGSFFVIPICSMEEVKLFIKVTLAIVCMIAMYGGIIYLIVRGVRISKEKEIKNRHYRPCIAPLVPSLPVLSAQSYKGM